MRIPFPPSNLTGPPLYEYLLTVAKRLNGESSSASAAIFSALDYGALGDGATDNATSFAALSAAANASTILPTVYFPAGTYKYSSGLTFTRNVHLLGDLGATLNYTGSGKAIKMGPDGLTDLTYVSHLYYVFEGLTLTGGASMTHGLYFNDHITKPRIVRCNFVDFGNATAYGIFCQSNNWDTFIDRCDWYTSPSAGPARNWISINGVEVGGTWDNGNSRLRMEGCLGSDQNQTHGVGIYVNGSYNDIAHNKIEGFLPNYRVGGNATGTRFSDVYFEVTDDGYCIEYGDPTGSPRVGAFLSDLRIEGCYVNLHNDDAIATTASFLGPTTSSTGLQNCLIDAIEVASLNAARPLVVLLNKTSQINNRAYSIRGVTILHTVDTNIAAWGGESGDAFSLPGNLNLVAVTTTTRGIAGNTAMQVNVTGDTNARWQIQASGTQLWGPGNAGADVNLYRAAANVLKTDDYFEMTELADPSAPATDNARLYVKDNGAGKTQLVVRFPTGAVQVIATEP